MPARPRPRTCDGKGAIVAEGQPCPWTVVIADDDVECCLLVRFILASESDTVPIVGEAGGGEEALALVFRKRPDIVVADLYAVSQPY